MMYSKTLLFSYIFIHLSVVNYAQTDTLYVTAESQILNGQHIQPYTNKWEVTHISGSGQRTPNRIWTDYGNIIELDDIKYFHRVQDLYTPNMRPIDTWVNMTELKSMLPVSFSTLNPQGGFVYYTFDKTNISGQTNKNTKENATVTVNKSLSKAVYDWNLYGMLLVALPFEEGLIAKIPFYNFQKQGTEWLVILVTGQEELAIPNDKKIKTWKIKTNKNLTFWISDKAPYVIKLQLDLPDNAQLLWEMI